MGTLAYGFKMSSRVGMFIEIRISLGLREDCKKFLEGLDELSSPEKLRAFADVRDLKRVRECIPLAVSLNIDELISKLLKARRKVTEPALFDLLGALEVRYKEKEDHRGNVCEELKTRLRREIPASDDDEQAEYQMMLQSRSSTDSEESAQEAERWIEEAGDDLDELALRITLSVFSGATFEVIERAKNDLAAALQPLAPAAAAENPPPAKATPPLMLRLRKAGAYETQPRPPELKRVQLSNSDLAREALAYVWQLHRESDWRQKFIQWLTSYATHRPFDVRTRAAIAAGRLAAIDYSFVRDRLLGRWLRADDNQAEYRAAIGMALGVLIREDGWADEVQKLLSEWSESTDQTERWAAARAYLYVGACCKPVKNVVANWRRIAASEIAAIDVPVSGNVYLRLANPLHMSLVDAMTRFFMHVGQLPEEEGRQIFEGILDGLEDWIASDAQDSRLGLFMFITLGGILTTPDNEQGEGAPALLRLVEEQPTESPYRKRLASLFCTILRRAASVVEAKELLCAWLEWLAGVSANAQTYESRAKALLAEIVRADTTERMRAQLIACVRDCAGSAAKRVLTEL
jgi:hypothetical protein